MFHSGTTKRINIDPPKDKTPSSKLSTLKTNIKEMIGLIGTSRPNIQVFFTHILFPCNMVNPSQLGATIIPFQQT